MTTDELKTKIAKTLHDKPKHLVIPAVALGVIVALAIAHVVITNHGRTQKHAPTAVAAQVSHWTPTPQGRTAHPAQIEPAPAAHPAQGVPASPASGPSVAAAAPAAAAPTPVAPPAGVIAGLIDEQVESRDQFDQWLKLSQRTLKLATLNLATPPAPAGFTGTRRIVYDAWIKTAAATSTVTLHAVGASAEVAATIDGTWSLSASHSNAWVSAPTVTQSVIALAPGWHRIALTVTTASAEPTAIELQLGAGDVDPIVPTPYAVPIAGAKP